MEFSPANIHDAHELAHNLRESDKCEVWASNHYTPLEAVINSVFGSETAYAIRGKGILLGVFGVARFGTCGSPWLLATNALHKYPIEFYRQSRRLLDEMLQQYSYLENYVDARNVDSIRWLTWLGYTIEEPYPYGAEGLPFRKFYKGVK